MMFWNVYRQVCAADNKLSAYLLTCSPFKAKKHLQEIDSYFIALNDYVAKEQHVRISLKIPKK